MSRRGICFLLVISVRSPRIRASILAAELEAGGSPRRKQIWRSNSRRLPVVAIKGSRRYWVGCNVAAAARSEVLLPEPTSPVMTVVRLWATA